MFHSLVKSILAGVALLGLATCSEGGGAPTYDVIISGGSIYDGSGGATYIADIALEGDRIVAIGELDETNAITVIVLMICRVRVPRA